MKILRQVGHQGDTQWFAIDQIPEDAQLTEKQFIAESERSGSMHALFGNYDMYTVEGKDGYIIDVKEECILTHSLQSELDKVADMDEAKVLPKKDHRHATIAPGKYFVGVQNRFDPMAGFREKVQD